MVHMEGSPSKGAGRGCGLDGRAWNLWGMSPIVKNMDSVLQPVDES